MYGKSDGENMCIPLKAYGCSELISRLSKGVFTSPVLLLRHALRLKLSSNSSSLEDFLIC